MFKGLLLLLFISGGFAGLTSLDQFRNHKLERVTSKAGKSPFPVESTHGYIKVNPQGSDIFYWMFPAKNAPETRPLCSSGSPEGQAAHPSSPSCSRTARSPSTKT